MAPRVAFELDGQAVEVDDDGRTLLDVLRGELGSRSVKDGCSPQGQCGCCTVLVDGAPRVACVTPARRVAGRRVTTVDGLDDAETWASAFVATGGSQCGFCTPGIVCRLSALRDRQPDADRAVVARALSAHLCRCTGWQSIVEAWDGYAVPVADPRDLEAAGRRATLEGRSSQEVSARVPLGRVGFADDTAPPEALVAVPDGRGGWAVGESLAEARQRGGKVQGRRSTEPVVPPLALPSGEWSLALRTSWVEPAYLETDASWCEPGGTPASSSANGGAFGGKQPSVAEKAARELADTHGRAVRVLLSREDVVRLGPKRPPVSIGMRADGTGVARVVATPGVADAIRSVAPGLTIEEVALTGPPTSSRLRSVGWGEAAVVLAGLRGERCVRLTSPDGSRVTAEVDDDGRVAVTVGCGAPLDEVVLRSYCIGATHMALGWVRSEGVAVDEAGVPVDLTIRSFGIVRPGEMPPVDVTIEPDDGPPVNASDAVFVAVAAAEWIRQGCPVDWPTRRT